MSKLKGILLTEGMHGMLSQVEGLAKALDIDFTHHKVELNNLWKLIPPKFTPISQRVYKKINQSDYDLIISCGRKSIIPSIHLKSISNKKVSNIHIQDPKINFNYFDFIVAPEHDGINGSNVITTKGALHYLSALSIAKYIIVTCDSTSMISESAITGKPIYIADIPSRKNDRRFKEFRKLFTNLNIIKTLGDNLEIWNYEKLDETNRIAKIIRNKLQ